jgi:hypothetical protein
MGPAHGPHEGILGFVELCHFERGINLQPQGNRALSIFIPLAQRQSPFDELSEVF